MAAKDPAARRTNALIAVNTSWARTPVRAERTENARRSSPGRIEYWVEKLRVEGVVSDADLYAAAENAQKAYMAGLVKKRKTKKDAKSTGRTRAA